MELKIISLPVYFFAWTFLLYIIHRLAHKVSFIKFIHYDHHKFIRNNKSNWHWSNMLLFNDTFYSTLDLWITEVIPTFIFSMLTGQWWIFVFYYIWAAFFQEILEHNSKINFYPFTFGQWHLVHHRDTSKNFGLFLPIWDFIFSTEKHKL